MAHVDAQGLPKALGGLDKPTDLAKNVAQVVMRISVIGISFKNLPVERLRQRQVAGQMVMECLLK